MKTSSKVAFALFAVLLALAPAAQATLIVVPNADTATPGPSNNAFPFNEGDMRYQQVFASGEFGGLTGLLTAIAFRPDETTGGAFNTTGIDTEIRLSHTTAAPNALSTTFANNIGPDETLVFDGLLDLSSDGTGQFDITIDIADSFFYNGIDNLLMDITVFNSVNTTQFDSAGVGLGLGGGGATDRVWARSANAATGISGGDDGYVTQFDIRDAQPAPEPATALLVSLGIAGLAVGRQSRRSKSETTFR